MKYFPLIVFCLIANKVSAQYSATYPEGKNAMEKYLEDSLRYPESEKLAGREAVLYVRFTITKEGNVTSPVTTASLNGNLEFDKEAHRLILAMPKWEPAKGKRGPVEDISYAVVKFELPDSLVNLPPALDDTATLTLADTMPVFMGGERGMQTYLMMNIRYPQMEREQGKEGTVYIYFVVEPNGRTTDVKCVKGVPGAPGLAREAIRVIKGFPRWEPAQQNGKAVRVAQTVPVRFVLE